MNDSISPAVQRLLHELGPEPTSSIAILVALLADKDGRPTQLLNQLGLSLRPIPTSRPPLDLAKLLHTARLLAQTGGNEAVTTDLILLALLQCDPELCQQLTSQGLDLAELETMVLGTTHATFPLSEPLELEMSSEQLSIARILDVNANRAREALRLLDDHCRFVLEDPLLTEQIKQFRHELAEWLTRIPAHLLLEARDTRHDVGTQITTSGESQRRDPQHIAQVNLKRLQEALRSLEEYAKTFDGPLANQLEQLRYRAYTIERTWVRATAVQDRLQEVKLYVLLTRAHCSRSLDWVIAEAAVGGVGMVQLREKELSDRALFQWASWVREWTRQAGVLFILNDRPDIARLVQADGVHLGQEDLPVHQARQLLGANALIGVSTHTLAQVEAAVLDGADYLGVGPVFPSQTKAFTELAGLEFIRAATALTTLPAFAIGGIDASNLPEVLAAGAQRIAVSASIATASDPRLAAQSLRQQLEATGFQQDPDAPG